MYVIKVVRSSESLITFDVFVLDAGDTAYVWSGEQCSQSEMELATFFAEPRKSVRNSDVEVSHTPDLKFWTLLGGEKSEIHDVRCVRNRSPSTKLWSDTLTHTVPQRNLVAERVARNVRRSSRKAGRARAREQNKEELGGALPRLESPSLCEVGRALKSHLWLCPRCSGLAIQYSRGAEPSRGQRGWEKKYETFFPFRCPWSPPKQRWSCP